MTGKVLGGALQQAKGAMSTFWSSLAPTATPLDPPTAAGIETADDSGDIEVSARMQQHTLNGIVEIGHEPVARSDDGIGKVAATKEATADGRFTV